jgi:hypothetical protein
VLAVAVAAAMAGAAWLANGDGAARAPSDVAVARARPLALFTSMPIYWGEARDFQAVLGGNAAPHWARAAIERDRPLRPLDTLDAETLEPWRDLLIVQPRPLSPDENVALDRWVAQGGRLLLFADPALTQDSAYAVGDPRRHQDVVLLSPILARWGLTLEFDEDQPPGEREVPLGDGVALPVNLPGGFSLREGGRGDARCHISSQALIAGCRIGEGRVLALADAAVFETGAGVPRGSRPAALAALLERAFAK